MKHFKSRRSQFILLLLISFSILTISETSYSTNEKNKLAVRGDVCLYSSMTCQVGGALYFSFGNQTACGQPVGEPFVWEDAIAIPPGCSYQTIIDDSSFIVESGYWGAHVQFLFTVQYPSGGGMTFDFPKYFGCMDVCS